MGMIIVTGMSGAGKSKTMQSLEDLGYFCVDNLPPVLLTKFAELCSGNGEDFAKVAVAIDCRGGDLFEGFGGALEELKNFNFEYKILFIDADDKELIHRYKETRRSHPLMKSNSFTLIDAIKSEREKMAMTKAIADYNIDTTYMSATEQRQRIFDMFATKTSQGFSVTFMSFGYKYGIPAESDLVFDVRCLPNPFYIPELKTKTGLDEEVAEYVLKWEQSQEFLQKLKELIAFLVPLYKSEGKSNLVISIGCTGGKHRSVTFARTLNKHFSDAEFYCSYHHRDINK